ncbi:hypothetical protein TNCV_565651 [Trichonephila clavipes]|nr:hypothetical protein TNCV_565651 [Trichonephila clavipes]
MGWDAQFTVRSKNQKQFFKMVGGFRNVCIVKPLVGNHADGCIHSHNRIISFPCAAKAARTLAVNLNRTHRQDSKKAIQCLGLSEVMDQCPMDKSNEENQMDKLDEDKLLEEIDKLLE